MFKYKIVVRRWVTSETKSKMGHIIEVSSTGEAELYEGTFLPLQERIRRGELFLDLMSKEGWDLVTIGLEEDATAYVFLREVDKLIAEEDIALAEAGIEEYAEGLKKEHGLSI